MKFLTTDDISLFLVEIGRVDLLEQVDSDFVVPQELVELFIKRRRELLHRIKDFRRSQAAKGSWRRNRNKYTKGIRRFHKSTAGKQFHRAMARFLVTRTFEGIDRNEAITDMSEILKALSSATTHIFIELDYFHPISEEIDYQIFVEDSVNILDRIRRRIMSNEDLSRDDEDFLFAITETSSIVRAFSDKTNLSIGEVESMWNSARESLIQEGKTEDECLFYGLIVSSLMKQINTISEA